MSGQQQQDKATGFKTIILLKDQPLGIGSYGAVCRAKCDDLLCAAKIIHPTLFDPIAHQIAPHREHRLPIKRFQLECEFLSTIRHPNIIQYLGTHQDPDTKLPVLLMELMDDNLTHFLENSPQPIPYHIQVNVCHDITLALSFLHSNGIIHRDLSSNNVLLISNVRAKVTDFGMARLGDQNPQLTFTMCPGTDAYMPPEAVKDKPQYTEKIDCFSFGVIVVQTITQEFPKPGDRRKRIQINQPGLPPIVEVPISEIERRQNHIGEIDPNHTLLQVALNCLKDDDLERPSAQQLCERVATLKEDPQYGESMKKVEARNTAELDRSDKRDREIRSLRQQHNQQVHRLQQIIQSQTSRLAEKNQTIARKEPTIIQNSQILREKDATIAELSERTRQLEKEKGVEVEEKERELRQKVDENDQLQKQLGQVKQQLEESKQINAQFQRRIAELEQLRQATDTSSSNQVQIDTIKLTWQKGKKAPYDIRNSYCAAVNGSTLYVHCATSHQMLAYNACTSSWFQLPDSPTRFCSAVIVNNLLTVVGGRDHKGAHSNKLFSLTGEGSGRRWTEEFPPMPTKRALSTALCIRGVLIVAGGRVLDRYTTQTVEVLNSETELWSTAADLPKSLSYYAPAAVCDDQIYIMEKAMYTCSVQQLLTSMRKRGTKVWKKIAAPPVVETACVSIYGRLLAIGGWGSDGKSTTTIHMYNPTTDSWEVISHMGTPRSRCIAALLPNNQLMVVGGYIDEFETTDSVEFATIE